MGEWGTEKRREEEERREERRGREGKEREGRRGEGPEGKEKEKGMEGRNILTINQGAHIIYQMTLSF